MTHSAWAARMPRPRPGRLPLVVSLLTACGGSSGVAPRAQTATESLASSGSADREKPLSTSAEVGGLDEREAEESFRASLDALQECVNTGVQRFDFLSGDIELAVKIDATRQAQQVWASQSTLGERITEKCMFDALRAVTWPPPIGGAYGIARNSFEFAPRKGSPEPAVWDAGRVAGALESLAPALGDCGEGAADGLLITMYIGEDGRALTGGAASEEPVQEDAVDCVVEALLAAEYPVPDRSPTKVRFRL